MASLEEQTAIELVADGTYRCEISTDWKMWVPVGGYLTALALRAAGAASSMARPVSITCHYLNEARFGPAELRVTTLHSAKRSESLLVKMVQDGTDVLACLVSAAPTGQFGPNVVWQEAPEAPTPDEIEETILDQDVLDIMGDEPFWKNLQFRMIKGLMGTHDYPSIQGMSEDELKMTPRRDAHIRGWQRMPGGEGIADPWIDAGRYVIIAAAMQFPVVADPFTPPLKFIAPTVNLTVDFHNFDPDADWLLADANGTHAGDGLLGADTRLWTAGGDPLVTAHSQMTYHDFTEPGVMEGLQKSWFELREA